MRVQPARPSSPFTTTVTERWGERSAACRAAQSPAPPAPRIRRSVSRMSMARSGRDYSAGSGPGATREALGAPRAGTRSARGSAPRPGRASRGLDLDRALEAPAVSVEERDREGAGLGDAESEPEGRILADGGGGVELRDAASCEAYDHSVDEAVVPVHRLAVLPLDALVGVDEERSRPRHRPPRHRTGHPDLDLAQRAHIAHPATTTRTERVTMNRLPSCISATARTSPVSARRRLVAM